MTENLKTLTTALTFTKLEGKYVAYVVAGDPRTPDTYEIENVGRGAKPWRATHVTATDKQPLLAADLTPEQYPTLGAARDACQGMAHENALIEAALAKKVDPMDELIADADKHYTDATPAEEAAFYGITTPEAAVADPTQTNATGERKEMPGDPRANKKAFLAANGDTKRVAGMVRKVTVPMYVLWRADGDILTMCNELAVAGLAGGWVDYATLAGEFGRIVKAGEEPVTDRHAGKSCLASLDRYLNELLRGAKLKPFGWELQVENKPAKEWTGARIRIVALDTHTRPAQPLVLRPIDQAEIFCLDTFGETRAQFGASCAEDFGSDEGLTGAEHIEKYGNPAADHGWFVEAMKAHGFKG